MSGGGRGGRIAVVDDERTILETVGFALEREGYAVDTHADGASAWAAFEHALPDLVVLDIVMPRMDGLALCRRLRGASEALPILFLSSRDDELDRVLGLELGGDDYLCKPFSMRELVARVKVLFRRLDLARGAPEEDVAGTLLLGELALDLDRYTASWRGEPVALTVTEFRLLRALSERPGHVKSRVQLIEHGYPDDGWVSERTVDSHVKRIRRKFEGVDGAFDALETVHGLGYRYREGR